MPLAIFALLALAVYFVSPNRVQWWMILAGTVLFYAFSDFDSQTVVLAASVPSYLLSAKVHDGLQKQTVLKPGKRY